MPRLGLKHRIFLVVIAIAVVSVVVETFFVQRFFREYVVDSTAQKVMTVAMETARDTEIIAAFGNENPSLIIQPIAERIRLLSSASYVVVFNMDTVRYSHPQPDRLGKRFVGGDEQRALTGERYISQALGTLGLSIRAFAPIRKTSGEQIGVVSVGILIQDLDKETRRIGVILATAAGVSLALGLFGAFGLSNNIKKTIFGLEPAEIATLLEERNVIISSIKEGIVAVDTDGRIILINENAKRLLEIEGDSVGLPVTEVIPNTKLMEVVANGAAHLDEEQIFNKKVLLTNRIPLISRNKTIGAVATFRDLSEVRTLAEELTEVKRYIDALRAQHHEFLNKLHVVSGLLQLERYDDAVHFIVKAVSVQQQVFDILRKKIEAPDVAALILAKMNEAQESNIDLLIDEKSSLPLLRQEIVASIVTIVGNLLQNAVESLRSAEKEQKTIRLSFRTVAGMLEIRVADNGNGIKGELRERIFEGGVTTKADRGNMGIGLSLVRMHARLLGGDVYLADSQDGGAEIVARVQTSETVAPAAEER
ncbi:MAG: sensor histidine kinase [Treponemataceae bacterium]